MKVELDGSIDVENFVLTLFKLLDIQNGTETSVSIRKRKEVDSAQSTSNKND